VTSAQSTPYLISAWITKEALLVSVVLLLQRVAVARSAFITLFFCSVYDHYLATAVNVYRIIKYCADLCEGLNSSAQTVLWPAFFVKTKILSQVYVERS
jgi:hypothetical protein